MCDCPNIILNGKDDNTKIMFFYNHGDCECSQCGDKQKGIAMMQAVNDEGEITVCRFCIMKTFFKLGKTDMDCPIHAYENSQN